MSWVAVVGGGVSLLGGLFGSSAAERAAQQQAQAQMAAIAAQKGEFNTITEQESPFMQGGYNSLGQLQYLLGQGTPGQGGVPQTSPGGAYGSLIQPFTADTFQKYSPAYQFQLNQGRAGVLNGDSSSVGALSGAALKDLTGYNQNLAGTAFNNAFNQYQSQQSNIYSRLSNLAQLGQNAAANTGQQGTSLAQSMGQNYSNIGTALGGGTVGAANALTGGFNNLGALLAYKGMNGGFGGGGGPGGALSSGTDTFGGMSPYSVQTVDPNSFSYAPVG